jgi:hypothetical protein
VTEVIERAVQSWQADNEAGEGSRPKLKFKLAQENVGADIEIASRGLGYQGTRRIPAYLPLNGSSRVVVGSKATSKFLIMRMRISSHGS